MFVLHRGDIKDFLPVAAQVTRLISEHAGLDVDAVVPVTRIPKTTSGKVQRYVLARRYVEGEFDAALEELQELNGRADLESASLTEIETRLKGLCEAALEVVHVSVSDNLFELGATSLHLIRIHEQIDQEYPGCLDLGDLHAHPTVEALARHLHKPAAPALARAG
jgi:aryl carrier-like protein